MVMLVIVFLLIALLDFTPLLRRKEKKEMVVFGLLFLLTLTVAIFEQIGKPLPSPMVLIDEFMKSIKLAYPAA